MRFLSLLMLAFVLGCGGGDPPKKKGPSLSAKIKAASEERDPAARANKLADVAAEQKKAGDVLNAEKTIDQALASCKEIDEAIARAHAWAKVGDTAAKLDLPAQTKIALDEARKAVDGVSEANVKAIELASIASTYGKIGKLDLAKRALVDAEQAIEGLKDKPLEQVSALLGVANIYTSLKLGDDAQRTADQALGFAKGISDRAVRPKALAITANKLKQFGRDQDALATFAAATEEAEQLTDAMVQAAAFLEIGRQSQQAKLPEIAKTSLDKANISISKINDNGIQTELKAQLNDLRSKL